MYLFWSLNMAQWEGFEFEKAIFYGVNSCHFRLSAPFLRYIASFCTLPHIRLKGENKGGKIGSSAAPSRRGSGDQAHVRRCCCALWAAWRPPSAAGGDGGQAHVRRRCCALWAARRPPSAAGAARVRHTSSGAAAPCGRPGGLLQLPGAAGVRHTSGGAAAPCGRPGSLLQPPGVTGVRHTSGGAAALCGRPGGLLQLPGVTGVRRTSGGAAASWAS